MRAGDASGAPRWGASRRYAASPPDPPSLRPLCPNPRHRSEPRQDGAPAAAAASAPFARRGHMKLRSRSGAWRSRWPSASPGAAFAQETLPDDPASEQALAPVPAPGDKSRGEEEQIRKREQWFVALARPGQGASPGPPARAGRERAAERAGGAACASSSWRAKRGRRSGPLDDDDDELDHGPRQRARGRSASPSIPPTRTCCTWAARRAGVWKTTNGGTSWAPDVRRRRHPEHRRAGARPGQPHDGCGSAPASRGTPAPATSGWARSARRTAAPRSRLATDRDRARCSSRTFQSIAVQPGQTGRRSWSTGTGVLHRQLPRLRRAASSAPRTAAAPGPRC